MSRWRLTLTALASQISSALAGDADLDWKQIVLLDAGPRVEFKSREEARVRTLKHLAMQEKSLRDFLQNHPGDSHDLDARLRLAHLLATRGDLQPQPEAIVQAQKILDDIETNPATPKDRVADAAFGKISIFMQRSREPNEHERDSLLGQARRFQNRWPADKRLAPLLAEVATLFDEQPKTKSSLLRDALSLATNPELKQRIEDDLKRLARLGQPLDLKFTALDGRAVNVADFRGKIVLVYFFANWSPPSILALASVRASAQKHDAQAIGISLDEDKAALEASLNRHQVGWPIFFDGKGWESPLVRSLGINALPTVWLLDRQGKLRTLNARRDLESALRQLREEK